MKLELEPLPYAEEIRFASGEKCRFCPVSTFAMLVSRTDGEYVCNRYTKDPQIIIDELLARLKIPQWVDNRIQNVTH